MAGKPLSWSTLTKYQIHKTAQTHDDDWLVTAGIPLLECGSATIIGANLRNGIDYYLAFRKIDFEISEKTAAPLSMGEKYSAMNIIKIGLPIEIQSSQVIASALIDMTAKLLSSGQAHDINCFAYKIEDDAFIPPLMECGFTTLGKPFAPVWAILPLHDIVKALEKTQDPDTIIPSSKGVFAPLFAGLVN